MPELRQNLATKEWVIIANERAKRPNTYVERRHAMTESCSPHDDACPFCIGNEEIDLEIARIPAVGDWKVRVVRNKFPALSVDGNLTRSFNGVRRRVAGIGYHEVLVEHPHHNTTLALMEPDEIQLVLEMYQWRGREISKDPRIEQIVYFKNHGERAGASLPHPHGQIIAMPMVPGDIRRRIEEARRYFDENGECVFCAMLNDELAQNERIIMANEHFVSFGLYAASSPFHAWIVPRRHSSSFTHIRPEETAALARVLRDLLRRLYYGLNDPDFNLIIRSAPVKEPENAYLHWYIALVPRLSRSAGFELGSGVRINPSLPEDCVDFLRQVEV